MTISQLYVPSSSVVALIDKTEKLVLKDFFFIFIGWKGDSMDCCP